MNITNKKILNKIENNGYVAYIVGGFVRDYLMGITSTDIDICTNATPKDLKRIFSEITKSYEKYGAVKLHINDKVIDITTFRRELEYIEGLPTKMEYTSSLEEDLTRRDFRMNTLCMDSEGNIIDLLDGKKDIDNKVIRTVKDVKASFKEDPSRILRAIRFMCSLKFKLDDKILKYIKENKEEVKKIKPRKRKEELDKLFRRGNVSEFLDFIKKYDLEDYLGIHWDTFKETDTIIGVWSELEVSDEYIFTKNEKEQIKKVKELLKKGKIDEYDVYTKGVFICTIAADILNIPKNKINLMYTNLPIKGIIDINITSEEICEVLNIAPCKKLGVIKKLLEKEIISGKLKNEKKVIIERLRALR